MEMLSSLRFYGSYNASIHYDRGSVVLDGDNVKVFDGQNFFIIERLSELSETGVHKSSSPKILPKNCTRCGAPVNSMKSRCEYCNCEY